MRSIMITSAPSTASSTLVVTRTPICGKPGGNQRRRRAHPHFGAELRQQQHVRAQHAAVQQVADDRDLQSLEAALALANRERVEQRLGRDARACRRRR